MAPDLERRAASRRRVRTGLVALAVGFSVAAGEPATAQPAPILLDDRDERDPVVPASSTNAGIRGCLPFEPATVVLRGRLAEREGTGADVTRVHLPLPTRRWERDRPYVEQLIGRTVRAEGRLFHQHTGHHHETLVLDAIKVALDRGDRR